MTRILPFLFFAVLYVKPLLAQESAFRMFIELPGLSSTRGGDELVSVLKPINQVNCILFCETLHLAVVETSHADQDLQLLIVHQLKRMNHSFILKNEVPMVAFGSKYLFHTIFQRNAK
ncbi:MAG TPA: hypothetical protein PL185_04590 [Flavobacteriales bacterium]|nr:hypothetical protein [Flavobacteriales bacterium]